MSVTVFSWCRKQMRLQLRRTVLQKLHSMQNYGENSCQLCPTQAHPLAWMITASCFCNRTCAGRRSKAALLEADVPKLEKLVRKGKNVTKTMIEDRMAKVWPPDLSVWVVQTFEQSYCCR